VSAALNAGERDENKLANSGFDAAHPHHGRLGKGDPLAKDWLRIRDHIVRPFLEAEALKVPLATVTTSAPSERIDGMDIFSGNRAPDWEAFKTAGFGFAVHKVSERYVSGGLGADDTFEPRWTATRSHGIIRGSFHYYRHIDGASGDTQAALVLQHLSRLVPGDLAPTLDFEQESLVKGSHAPTAAGWRTEIESFLDTIERTLGRTPIIYTSYWAWYLAVQDHHSKADVAHFMSYPLWLVRVRLPAAITVDGKTVGANQLGDEQLEKNWKKPLVQREAGMVADWRYDQRKTSFPYELPPGGEPPPPTKQHPLYPVPEPWVREPRTAWAIWQYSGLTPGKFLRGGDHPLGLDGQSDFDVTRGGIHALEGLADLGRFGLARAGGTTWVTHREAGRTHVLLGGTRWASRDATGEGGLVAGASDAVLLSQGAGVYAYYRVGDRLFEATATQASPFAGSTRTEGTLLDDGVIHDPRVAADASKRCVVYWANDPGVSGRPARDDWQLRIFEAGRWAPARAVLSAASVRQAPSGQPTVYLQGSVVHIVGRVGSEGHLVDVACDAGRWTSQDYFDGSFTWPADENAHDPRHAATYSPTVYTVGNATFVAFRSVRGEIYLVLVAQRSITNLWSTTRAPSRAAGHPTSFVVENRPHIVFRAVDGKLYDIFYAQDWTCAEIDCGDEVVGDPVATSDGRIGFVTARTNDGAVRVARFEAGTWTCEQASP